MTAPSLRTAFEAAAQAMTRREAIVFAVDKAIDDGVLPAGTRLPTVRALSTDLEVSPSTVAAAYDLLRARGRIAGEVGRGTFVLPTVESGGAAVPDRAPLEWRARLPQQRPPWRRRMVLTSANRLLTLHPAALDCTRGKPDSSLILTEIVKRAMRRAAEETRPDDLQYASPTPLPKLREALLPRLLRDNIPVDGTEMVVGSSAQQLMVTAALAIATRLMPDRPPIVAVEEPGYQTVFDAFEYFGFRLIGMTVDEDGVTANSLDAALRGGAIAALFTPRALNPMGVSWTRQRRLALADILEAHPHVVAIEDDQFADLALTRPGSLLDGRTLGGRTVYIRTFAKSIAPDLRVAVALARPRLANLLAEAKSLSDGWTSLLSQRALAYALTDPELDGALDAVRNTYRTRRQMITNSLNASLRRTGAQITGSDGLNIWIRLPFGMAATEVVDRAASLGVLLVSGEPFYIRPGHNDVIRMSISGVSDKEAETAADRLVEAIRTSADAAMTSIPI